MKVQSVSQVAIHNVVICAKLLAGPDGLAICHQPPTSSIDCASLSSSLFQTLSHSDQTFRRPHLRHYIRRSTNNTTKISLLNLRHHVLCGFDPV